MTNKPYHQFMFLLGILGFLTIFYLSQRFHQPYICSH